MSADVQISDKLLDRIRALLAKAESSEFPDEAEAFTAKAQELMARYCIDQAVVADRARDKFRPGIVEISVQTPYESAKILLLQVVADANRCRSVWNRGRLSGSVVGHAADLQAVELLFTSLLIQATRAMMTAQTSPDRIRSFRHAFLTSYAYRIGERLREATKLVVEEKDLLPVLARHSAAVTETFTQMFPQIKRTTSSISNREGWAQGRVAADRATLNEYPEIRGF